jgi:hypothetical protein
MEVQRELSPAAGKGRVNARRPVGRVAERILRKVWTIRLARADFRDLENPENPDAPLSNAGMPSHLFDGLTPAHWRECLESGAPNEHLANDGYRSAVSAVAWGVEATAEYYRRIEHLSWRFDDDGDRAIAVALSDGIGIRRIKAELSVGQHRVERVLKQVRIWMAEKEPIDEE